MVITADGIAWKNERADLVRQKRNEGDFIRQYAIGYNDFEIFQAETVNHIAAFQFKYNPITFGNLYNRFFSKALFSPKRKYIKCLYIT